LELKDGADLSDGNEGLRGGRGGAFFPEDEKSLCLGLGDVSRLIKGAVRGFVSVAHCE
jgi:hypothetical protein